MMRAWCRAVLAFRVGYMRGRLRAAIRRRESILAGLSCGRTLAAKNSPRYAAANYEAHRLHIALGELEPRLKPGEVTE